MKLLRLLQVYQSQQLLLTSQVSLVSQVFSKDSRRQRIDLTVFIKKKKVVLEEYFNMLKYPCKVQPMALAQKIGLIEHKINLCPSLSLPPLVR